MADATYQPKIYRSQGGDTLTAASGGTVVIDSGATLTNSGTLAVPNGGEITLAAGGAIRPATGQPLTTYRDPPATDDTTNTDASEAEILAGLIVKTPTAAQDWQLPKGTEISTAVGSGLTVGDSFQFTMINLGGTGDIVTLTNDTGTSVVGYMGVHPATDGATLGHSCGTFLFRNSAANTWIVYRIG